MEPRINVLPVALVAVCLAIPAWGAGESAAVAFVNGVRVEGATPGEWTHDWDAASAAAKKDRKPIFINFTGSDWCGWCKLLKRQVFTQPEWGSWASNNVYLVHIDFPNDKKLVPEKYRERNKELSRRYKVKGYPTCYLLDSAKLEPLGRFGASRDITASSFIEKVAAAMPGAKSDPPAGMASGDRTVQRSAVTTNDFKAVLTGVAVVDDKRRHEYDEAVFVPPEAKVVVPYGRTALFRVEYDFPEGYAARVWTRDGLCDDGKIHSWYFGSNPSEMFKGKGTAYGFLSLRDSGKTCRVRELLLKTSVDPELDRSPREWTIAVVPVDIEFLEMQFTLPMAQDKTESVQPAVGIIDAEPRGMETRGISPEVRRDRGIIDIEPKGMETWGISPEARRDRAVFDTLLPSYRIFAGRTSLERMEMKEEQKQYRYLMAKENRDHFLTKHPNASFKDYMGYGADTPLRDVEIPAPSFLSLVMISKNACKWTPLQLKIAIQVSDLGRPLSSIDPTLPLAKQYEAAKFDILAQVAAGRRRSSLTDREMSILIAEADDARHISNRSQEAYQALLRRLQKEDQEDAQNGLSLPKGPYRPRDGKNEFSWEYVNGERVFTEGSGAPDSIYDEIIRRVAERYKREKGCRWEDRTISFARINLKEWEPFWAKQNTR